VKFDDLPLLLRLGDLIRVTGLDRRVIFHMTARGKFEVVKMNQTGRRYYTRESVKKFLNVKGQENIPD